jgi:acetaldehyde dehydrogenase
MNGRIKVAVIGSGNIGTDLMIKIMRKSDVLEMGVLVGADPASDGLARAERLGVAITAGGLTGLRAMGIYKDISIVFDATSASAHFQHAAILKSDGKIAVDLTPAAVGPFVVPSVNLDANLHAPNVNMVTCGGQATIPIIAAVSSLAPLLYAEIVASISSRSAGPGTRANIDEFTQTTARAIESVGGAQKGKAVIVLNPADPPMIMRDTIYCLAETEDQEAIRASIGRAVAEVQAYVPGFRLKQDVQFEQIHRDAPVRIPGIDVPASGLKVTVFVEVEGAAHYLPAYAGNLDIMTSAALRTGERIAQMLAREVVA